VLAGTLVSPTLASWLKSAQTLVMPSLMPVRSVVKSVFVQVSGDMERGTLDVVPVQNGIDVASIVALPLFAGSLVLGDALMVTVFGAGYGGSGFVLAAVAAAMVWQSQGRILTTVLNGSDNPDAAAMTNVSHALVYPALFAVAFLVADTAAFLSLLVVAYATWTGTAYRLLGRRALDTGRLSWRFVAEQTASAGVMAVLVAGLWTQVTVHSWIDLVAPIGAGGLCYGLLLLTISTRARSILNNILKRALAY
jgi:O-antigen/teichoic acid export membrane protein